MKNILRTLLGIFVSVTVFGCSAAATGSGGSGSGAADTDDTGDSSGGSAETAEVFNRTDVAGDLKLLLPFPAGDEYAVIQGYGGAFSHSEACIFNSLDFDMPEGSSIAAAADGRVMAIREDSNANGLTQDYWDQANYVLIDHGFGVYSTYLHLCQNCVEVEPGDEVGQGQVIGESGNTGFSSAPHLHFEIRSWEDDCSEAYGFYDVAEDGGIPLEGASYASENSGGSPIAYAPSEVPDEAFSANGVVLTESLPWVLERSQTYDISGQVTNGQAQVAVFLIENAAWVDGATASVNGDGTFSISYTVSAGLTPGAYTIGIATSDNGSYFTEFSKYGWVE